MAQQLRALDAFPENSGLISNIYVAVYNCLQLWFQCLLRYQESHSAQISVHKESRYIK